MKFKAVLSKLDTELGSKLEVRRYTLPGMISESYKTLYSCESGTNMQRLVESHLEDVKKNPTDTERLSRQLAIIKEVQKLTESGEINDKDLDAATDSEYEGDVAERLHKERKETAEEVFKEIEAAEELKESTEETTEEEDLLEDTELTDEEVEALTQHLAEIRKNKKVTESDAPEFYQPTKEEAATIVSRIQRKYGNEISEEDYLKIIGDVLGEDDVATDIIDHEREKAGIKIIGESSEESKISESYRDEVSAEDLREIISTLENIIDEMESKELESIRLQPNTYGISHFISFPSRGFLDLYSPFGEEEDDYYEAKTYESLNLSEFRKKSAGKAFVKTFKKLDKQLHEGTALTRQEAISLYKAANSAMTHLSVELEHNPEFLSTFKESVSLLSVDVSKLLESMKNGKAPSEATMKSLAKFSEAMLREADEEEELPPIEDEEDTLTDEEIETPETDEEETTAEVSEEEEEFDREYADARIELHKEMQGEHADDETPAIADKLTQDAEEILDLPGITKEQADEIQAELEETPSEDTDESADPEEDAESGEKEEETTDLDLGDEGEITDDELAELKKHLREMRAAGKVTESKGRKLARRK